MNKDLRAFNGGAFSAEMVDHLDDIRLGLPNRGEGRLSSLRNVFREIIASREVDRPGWSRMTDIEFDDEDSLYAYLDGCYRYFFEEADDFPGAPY